MLPACSGSLIARSVLFKSTSPHIFPIIQFVRLFSQNATPKDAAAVVVGAGPAGIAVVGNLLGQIKGDGKIIWVDEQFQGGRINRFYREVPGNTAVKLLVDYAEALKPFQHILNTSNRPNAITALENLPQDGTCSLSYAGDMLNLLTAGLKQHPRIHTVQAKAQSAHLDPKTKSWTLATTTTHPPSVTAPLVVYCTGAFPTTTPLPPSSPPTIPLDTALTPSILSTTIPRGEPFTISVIGGSHSAILVLMNLYTLASTTHPLLRIKWFTRHPTLRYAVQKDGYIQYDNTGLKGRAAEFARTQLDGDVLLTSEAGKFITRIDCSGGKEKEWALFDKELKDCGGVIQAVGYTPAPIPEVRIGDGTEVVKLGKDARTGAFFAEGQERKRIGLFGAGIAFPEEVCTPEGEREYAVGMWKFMNFLKRVVPGWVEESRI
ncbi:pyridine nucleotide-disulfide oxidoreductase-domain-containing protein [Triangularia verruculosa]|uniref:Pyridine nucleotide-disulfide oxidoreductase-domain-containing protein n=1 Tax=Triangularia verruculosa TaxID=2587418 RepID=A0AAN7AUY3_9PEZI|nr:pyridine nucleotide-disulfide oxidoreductase-domain-containing protein [Triangularia verruculosa]